MQQVLIPRIGDPDVLQLIDRPDPDPAPGQLRVKVAAAGVNFADLMARMGLYPDAPPLPAVVGYEVSGVVDAVGEGVPEGRLGERVVAMTRFGGYASHVCIDQRQATVVPEGLDLKAAASIPVTGLTAWMMLEEMGRVRAGDRVLVHSAGGGVGLMALDLLRWRGAIAVGTASSAKHALLTERGYARLVDYRNEDFEQALKDEGGFDLILDPVGGESWAKGLRLLRPGGRLICFGMSSNATGSSRNVFSVLGNLLSVPWLRINPISLMNDNKGVMGVNMGHMWGEGERIAGWLHQLMGLWAEGVVRPMIHAEVPFSEAASAHALLHGRENLGKVLLVPDA